MPITFHPHSGSILICDFSTGFQPPEMVKVRPVVVLSPRRRTSDLVTVVPLSSTPPVPRLPWHLELPTGAYPPARGAMWAKCDVVVTVALRRLDQVRTKGPQGQRAYSTPALAPETFAALQLEFQRRLGVPGVEAGHRHPEAPQAEGEPVGELAGFHQAGWRASCDRRAGAREGLD